MFLDVERDLYVAVHKTRIDALGPWLSTAADIDDSSSLPRMPGSAESIAQELVAQGLLTFDELRRKTFEPVIVPSPRVPEIPPQPLIRNAIRFARFYAACRAAHRKLTTARVRETVDFVRCRKAQRHIAMPPRRDRLISLVSTFQALRLFYPRPYLCLFDSLALIEFLAMYEIYPTWIFGVQGEPFLAHCWVQHGDLLLNDSLHKVARLTPIMTV